MFRSRAKWQIRQLNIVSYVEEDGMVYAQEVASWGLDRVDQRSVDLDKSFTPRGKCVNSVATHILYKLACIINLYCCQV